MRIALSKNRNRLSTTPLALFAAAWLLLGMGCSNGGGTSAQKLPVGSACTADSDCGSMPFYCMLADHPGGYCMRLCNIASGDTDCPSEAICQYDGMKGECHRKCDNDPGCRSGYFCSLSSTDPNNRASHAFCDVAPTAADGGTRD